MQQKRRTTTGLCYALFFIFTCFTARGNPPLQVVLTEASWLTPNIIRVPFKLSGTLITVRARVDSLEGNFFFDTGASGLVLNYRHFGTTVRQSAGNAGSVTGTVKVEGQKNIDSLQLDNLIVRNISADLVDLTHIELAKKVDIAGLLGMEVFKDFEILVDYSASLLMLIRINHKGIPLESVAAWEYQSQGSFPLDVKGHVAMIKLQFGHKKKWFALDSGAEQNLLNHLVGKRFLKENFDILKRVKLRGAAKESIEVLTGTLLHAQLDTFSFKPMATILTNLDEINATYRTHVDGILGYEFLSQRPVSINLKSKRLTFYTKGSRP